MQGNMGRNLRWLMMVPQLAVLVCAGQSGALDRRFNPEELREDVEAVRKAIHHLHPDPYRYASSSALDQRFDSLSAALALPITAPQFQMRLAQVLRTVGDAHLRAALPSDLGQVLRRSTPLLPAKVRIIDGALYIEEELMGFRAIPPGNRVRRINGIPVERLLMELSAQVSTDGQDRAYVERVVERDFTYLLAVRHGTPAQYAIEHSGTDGALRTSVLQALTGEEIDRSYRPAMAPLRPWRMEAYEEEHTGWLTLRTLDRDSLSSEGIDPARHVDLVLQELRSKELRTLVIDLRGAGGADLGMAELVFSLIAKEPYRVVQEISMRQPEGAKDGPALVYASVGERALPAGDGAVRVPADDPRLAYAKPYVKAFQGKVYVVCDGLTRDAGAAFVMLARRSGRARIVGEEVGSNSRSFCGGREQHIELPRSKVRLVLPLTRFVPEGQGDGPADRGEQPHHTVSQQPWGLVKGRDTVKFSLLEMIRELQ